MAIAIDATSSNDTTGTSLTIPHTCTGSNLILFVGTNESVSGRITGVTYAGVPMTQIGAAVTVFGTVDIRLWYLIAPATGTNDIVVTASSSTALQAYCASYTGAKQSGVPDANNTGTVAPSTSITVSVTTIADNCWLVGTSKNDAGAFTAGANTLVRVPGGANCLCDSNGAQTPAGSFSQTLTFSNGNAGMIVASFAPATAAATSHNLSLLGVGT